MGQKEEIDFFIEKVTRVYEIDYGDFKRKIGQYLSRLEQSLGPGMKPEAKKTIQEMRSRLIYHPNPDIEIGRETAIAYAQKLRQSLN